MRPVDQTTYGCFRACVASILEVPLGTVPCFLGPRDPWFAEWLADQGLQAVVCRGCPPGYSIAGGPSVRLAGMLHACVALDGILIHDPHPSRAGLPLGILEYVVIC